MFSHAKSDRLLYKRQGVRPVIDCPVAGGADSSSSKPDKKRILFAEQYQKPEDLPPGIQTALGEYLKAAEPYELSLTYDNFDASIFRVFDPPFSVNTKKKIKQMRC